MIEWQELDVPPHGRTLHRARLNGKTVACIDRMGSSAVIVAADRYGRETQAHVVGDTLEQNKLTARDMLASKGHNV